MPVMSGKTTTTTTTHYRYTRDELLKILGFRDDEIPHLFSIQMSPPVAEGEPGGRPWQLVITFQEVEEH